MTLTNWESTEYGTAAAVAQLDAWRATGGRTVVVVPTWYQDNVNSTVIRPHPARSPSDAAVSAFIVEARKRKMRVILKPHVDILDGTWRGNIRPSAEKRAAWFASYRNFIYHWAEVAPVNLESFVIGTELGGVSAHTSSWRTIIAGVRERLPSTVTPLTYAANWDEYRAVGFWDALASISIDAYFPLSAPNGATTAQLHTAWQRWYEEINAFRTSVGKPVRFGELGYQAVVGTHRTPWWTSGATSEQAQERAYRAALCRWRAVPWLLSIYWWDWNTTNYRGNLFSAQDRLAHTTLTDWFAGRMTCPA